MTSRQLAEPDPGANSAPMLVRLRGLRPSLSPSEDRVAQQIVTDPRGVSAMTISELAAAASTSVTTVLRLTKRVGLSGYPQLRLALAEEAAQPRTMRATQTDIDPTDTVDDVVRKIALADASAVEETAQQLDRKALAEAAKIIARSVRIDIYGAGASAVVATDLHQKLHRIGCLAFLWSDAHAALSSAALLGPRDVAIAVSHSGKTRETIESITRAKTNGAHTIAITNFSMSPLAQIADVVLTTAARETVMRSGAKASRIAALTVVDCLYVVVAQQSPSKARKAVRSTREALATHQVEN
ncbi:MurR/RpiR family transcriptional regulator [Nonomuraea sp. NPDC003707]